MKKKRKDTKLASTGAEFIVMGRLLLNEIQTYKTYVNFEGYDLVSVNPQKNKSAKIQVKSKNFKNDLIPIGAKFRYVSSSLSNFKKGFS